VTAARLSNAAFSLSATSPQLGKYRSEKELAIQQISFARAALEAGVGAGSMSPEPRHEGDYGTRQVEAARRVLVDVGQVLASFGDAIG
jgi:hypothetical protein